METYSPRIRSLLRQAERVAEAGKRSAAEKLYREILAEAPETTPAWIGLAQVIRDPDEKERALRTALELEPENKAAIVGLAEIEEPAPNQLGDNFAPETVKTKSQPVSTEPEVPADVVLVPQTKAPIENSLSYEKHELPEPERVEIKSEGIALYCANHPNRGTHLRCNRCGKPICSSCANPTPVGYRCPECIREQEDVFFNARPIDYIIAAIVAFPLSLIAGYIATFLGFWSIFLGAAAGSLIGRMVFRAAGRRRGRWLPQLVGTMVVIGAILPAIPFLLALLFAGHFDLRLIWSGIYLVTAAGSAYYQMR